MPGGNVDKGKRKSFVFNLASVAAQRVPTGFAPVSKAS